MSDELESRLDAYGAAVESAARNLLVSGPEHAGLYDMVRYHLGWFEQGHTGPAPQATGKRLRPALCFLVTESLGADWQVALPVATAVELVHNFSLIHDDIEDASRFRHHRETVWAKWGTPQAINTGDALLMVAHQAVLETEPRLPADIGAAASRLLTRTCRELCEGQYLDLLWESAPSVTVEEYLGMVERKTARLFECAAALGALCAGAQPDVLLHVGLFARALGMSFQVADDILGIWSPQALTGKTAALDVMSRKKTLPITLALGMHGHPAAARLRVLFGVDRPLEDAEASEAIELLDELGVRQEALRFLGRFREEAADQLSEAGLGGKAELLQTYIKAALPEL